MGAIYGASFVSLNSDLYYGSDNALACEISRSVTLRYNGSWLYIWIQFLTWLFFFLNTWPSKHAVQLFENSMSVKHCQSVDKNYHINTYSPRRYQVFNLHSHYGPQNQSRIQSVISSVQLTQKNTTIKSCPRLLHSPSLAAIELSVHGYETWPPIGWHHRFVIGWSKDRLGLLSAPLHYGLTWPVGIPTVIQTQVTVPLPWRWKCGGPVNPTPIREYNGLRGENRGPFKGQQASASNPVMWLP